MNKGIFILIGIISLIGCKGKLEKLGDFRLLPTPQQFDITGPSNLKYDDIQYYYSLEARVPVLGNSFKGLKPTKTPGNAQVIFSIDQSLDLKTEGYVLEIFEDEVKIIGKDKAGLLYGFLSLEQLMEDAKDQNVNLPICSIKDYPMLAYRAIHIDIKHHREKTEYYYELMDRLASYKVNAIIAEVEDKIKYVRQPEVGSSDAMTISEWRKLCDYALERNIEISPLVQGLGHASFILKHDKYKELRDDPESDWAFNPLDPKTYQVQFDLYLDAMEATPHGKYLHVGGDEVHTTGRGSDKSPLELQLMWLNKVCQFAAEHDRTPIFWDDMPLKHANVYGPMFNTEISREEVDERWSKNEHKLLEFIDLFPKNCIYMRWNYQRPGTYGNLKAMDWFTSNGFKVMGATAGQTRWVLMPQNQSNIENIKSFALSSIEKGLSGLLLTLWDDDSPHFELYMRGIMAFAEYTWSGDKKSTQELKMDLRHRAFGPGLSEEDYAFIDMLEQPVQYWKNVLVDVESSRNSLAKTGSGGIIDIPDPNNKGGWSDYYQDRLTKVKSLLITCDSVTDQINKMKRLAVRNQYTLEVYEQVNELVKYSFESLVALENYDKPSEVMSEVEALKEIELLSKRFTSVRSEFEEVYSKTRILNKPNAYILDQDHHRHSANQSTSFDWQFIAELMLLEKVSKELIPAGTE
jgi:hypothetical protein